MRGKGEWSGPFWEGCDSNYIEGKKTSCANGKKGSGGLACSDKLTQKPRIFHQLSNPGKRDRSQMGGAETGLGGRKSKVARKHRFEKGDLREKQNLFLPGESGTSSLSWKSQKIKC